MKMKFNKEGYVLSINLLGVMKHGKEDPNASSQPKPG